MNLKEYTNSRNVSPVSTEGESVSERVKGCFPTVTSVTVHYNRYHTNENIYYKAIGMAMEISFMLDMLCKGYTVTWNQIKDNMVLDNYLGFKVASIAGILKEVYGDKFVINVSEGFGNKYEGDVEVRGMGVIEVKFGSGDNSKLGSFSKNDIGRIFDPATGKANTDCRWDTLATSGSKSDCWYIFDKTDLTMPVNEGIALTNSSTWYNKPYAYDSGVGYVPIQFTTDKSKAKAVIASDMSNIESHIKKVLANLNIKKP